MVSARLSAANWRFSQQQGAGPGDNGHHICKSSQWDGVGDNVCQLFCVKLYLLVLATLVNFLDKYKNHHLRQSSDRILIRTWLLYGWRKSDKIEIIRSVSRWLILSGDIVTLQIPGPGTVTEPHTPRPGEHRPGLRQQRLICACFIFQH